MLSAGEGKALAIKCIRCESEQTRKDGQTQLGGQRWRCNDCGRRFTARSTSAFSHHGFPDDVIALAVRWYVRYCLSYADVVEWFAERGLVVNRSTVYRWVQRFLPLFGASARVHRRQVGEKWRVDETYTRLNGKWTYIYRAIDQDGQVVDAYFSKRRNAEAAEGFFRRAIDATGVTPKKVTTDKAKCYPPALCAVLPDVEHRTSKYLNNGIGRQSTSTTASSATMDISNNAFIPCEASSKRHPLTSSPVGMASFETCATASLRSRCTSET